MINYTNGRETMKVIVQPTGPHMYINAPYNEEIRPQRPSVVTHSPFVDGLVGKGDLTIKATGLPMKATDAEFFDAYIKAEKDTKLAISAFCAEFGLDPKGGNIETETDVEPIDELDKLSYAELKEKATAMGIEFKGQISAKNLKELIKEHKAPKEVEIEDHPFLKEIEAKLKDGEEIKATETREEDDVVIYTIFDSEGEPQVKGTLLELHEAFVKQA